jgi:hypothetical protein
MRDWAWLIVPFSAGDDIAGNADDRTHGGDGGLGQSIVNNRSANQGERAARIVQSNSTAVVVEVKLTSAALPVNITVLLSPMDE